MQFSLENFLLEEFLDCKSFFLPQLLFDHLGQQFLDQKESPSFPGFPISSKNEDIQIDQTLPFCSIVGEDLFDPLYKIRFRFHFNSLMLRLLILLHEELRLSKYINSPIGIVSERKPHLEFICFACLFLA